MPTAAGSKYTYHSFHPLSLIHTHPEVTLFQQIMMKKKEHRFFVKEMGEGSKASNGNRNLLLLSWLM